MKESKTNAIRMLDQAKIPFGVLTYESNGIAIDGEQVAKLIGRDVSQVFKTLVTQGSSRQYYVAMIPSHRTLNLKQLAKIAGEKSVEMIAVKHINSITGYIRGGCSPIGMKKLFPTFIDASCQTKESVIFSAGKIGLQLEVNTNQLLSLIPMTIADLCL